MQFLSIWPYKGPFFFSALTLGDLEQELDRVTMAIDYLIKDDQFYETELKYVTN